MNKVELFNDHFQNFKVYGIPKAQLIIADPPYNLGKKAYDTAHWVNRRELFTSVDFKNFEPRKGFRCAQYFD